MLKIGWIDYINTLPFNFEFTGVKVDTPYQFLKGVPSKINQLLREGQVDVGCISSAEYIENKDRYVLLPDLSISATNKVHSVAVFSNVPIEKVETIYLSKASKSSRMLTKIVMEVYFKKKVFYKDLENYENLEEKTVLLIGDNAIRFSDKFRYIYDLSEIWKKLTGLPFVFAVWCARVDAFNQKKSQIEHLTDVLRKSKERFFKNLNSMVEKIPFEDKEFLKQYFLSLDYSFTKKHTESLKLFEKYIIDLKP